MASFEFVRWRFARDIAIGPVTIEMKHVIVAWVDPQVLAKLVERGRAQHVYVRRQSCGLDQLN